VVYERYIMVVQGGLREVWDGLENVENELREVVKDC